MGLPSAALLRAEETPHALELQWEAPEDCPDSVAFLTAISRLVGSAERVSNKVRADIRIERDSSGNYRLKLTTELNAISGERVLQGHSCHAVADAAVITLALILNPDIDIPADGGIELPAKRGPQTSSVDTKPLAAPNRLEPHRPEVMANSPIRWFGSGALGLEFGILPKPEPEVSLGFGAAFGKYSGVLQASYGPPQTILLTEPSGAGGRLWDFTLSMTACWSASLSAPRVGACVEGAWTHVQGYGLGVPQQHGGATNWTAPGLGIFIDLPLNRRAMFHLAGNGFVPIVRPDTHLDFVGIVQRPAQLTANLQAGVVVFFD